MRGERREDDDAALAHRGRDRGDGRVFDADEAEVRGLVRERTAPVHTGQNPGATVLRGGGRQRDPAGQVLLGFDVGVPVVLVPGEGRLGAGLLVDRLIPVETHVGTDEVMSDLGEGGFVDERAELLGLQHEVRRERDLLGPRDEELPTGLRLEELRHPLLDRVDRRREFVHLFGREDTLEHDEALLVVLPGLRGSEAPEPARSFVPDEAFVSGVERECHGGVSEPPVPLVAAGHERAGFEVRWRERIACP